MLSLRLLLLLRFSILTAALFVALGCGDDDGGEAGGGGSGAGQSDPDASSVVDILGQRDSGTRPSLGDGGTSDGGGGDSGPTPDDAGGAPSPACGNGRLDGAELCDPGLDPCCTNTCSGPIAKGHVCRAAEGDCDQDEACDGRNVDCPDDERVEQGTVCRPADGMCDRPEECDGDEVDCPDDELEDEGTECRPADGMCDRAEECDGEHAECPDDELEDEGTECRPADGMCDRAEECDGEDSDCPGDELADDSTSCRDAVDSCDAEELCTGDSKLCPDDLPDHCSAEVLGGVLPFTVTGTTTGTCAMYVPMCASTGSNANEHEYVYTAPRAGIFRFDTYGSSFDTVLVVRSSIACTATELACSDDGIVGLPPSVVEVELAANETVLVIIDGYQGAAGNFELTVRDAGEYEDWTCQVARFGDGHCDCGCGSLDVDCDDETADACERCTACGDPEVSCAGSPKIASNDNSQCSGWICPSSWYGVDDGCDCGCGILDPDCSSADPSECDYCDACGDPNLPCDDSASVDTEDNTTCAADWTCNDAFYGSGDGCDCGCGILDPDCASALSAACYFCDPCGDMTDGCAGSATVDPNHNSQCAVMTPVWTCDPEWFDSGFTFDCDCGCGIFDPDCASANASDCDYCGACREADNTVCDTTPRVVPANNALCQ